jgi:hypothetical protein
MEIKTEIERLTRTRAAMEAKAQKLKRSDIELSRHYSGIILSINELIRILNIRTMKQALKDD